MPEGFSLKEEIEQLRQEGDRAYDKGEWDTALSKFKAVTALALTLNLKPVLSEGYRKCAHIERNRGNFRAAERMYEKAIAVSVSDQDMAGIADALQGLSTMHFRKGQYIQALRYGQEALQQVRALKDPNLIGSVLIDVGNILCVTGKYDDGMAAYEEALGILPEEDFFQIGRVLNNIGETHKRHKRYKEAIVSLEKSISLGLDKGEMNNRAWSLFCAAECHARLGDTDKALEYLDASEPLLKAASDEVGLQELYKVRAITLNMKGDQTAAKELFERSIKLGKRLNLPAETAATYVEFGLMLEAMGDRAGAKGCLTQAEALYQGVRLDKELTEVRAHLERLLKA
jgi:tetratricopeptide (TPR) repeat protein